MRSSFTFFVRVRFVLSSSFFVLRSRRSPPTVPGVETLRAVGGLPPEICNVFREPLAFQQTRIGHLLRLRSPRACGLQRRSRARGSRKIVEIGGEGGRLLEPTAFDVAPDGTFAVADAPRGQERLQVFDSAGNWIAGFFLPGRAKTRISVGGLAMGGVSTLAFLGSGIALNQPETGSLITEYGLSGTPVRSIGMLRATGHESDRQLHLAMNTGIPLPHPAGGYYFVFLAGSPRLPSLRRRGALLFERVMQGRELDPVLEQMPKKWPRRTIDGAELPLVVPTVRTAAVDPQANSGWRF